MANKYPYVASAGPLLKTVAHLRRSFPKEVTAETLKKLGVAPKNESYVINVLRFLGIVDDEGKKVDGKTKAFLQTKEESFRKEFETLVRDAYEELFELHGDATWKLDRDTLAQFFRTADHSTDIVGRRQAGTFTYLAGLSGHSDLPQAREDTPARRSAVRPKKSNGPAKEAPGVERTAKAANRESGGEAQVGLTVRIEVNLPAEGDQETYDMIFRSIRKNLINAD